MTQQFRAKFIDSQSQIFLVNEVVQAPAGLTVHYTKESTGEKYSCLLDAFTERFRQIENNND